ncbi:MULTISPECIES: hypothetical protein [unclassified Microcoleus]|uniref:hypothetical protein n=1 Tax=unclassified Microcoleus TaxID=2642155 RepID=UPI002FCEFD80
MSVYKNSINAFIYVLESKPDLIPLQDWDELNQLASNLPEDAEEISERIQNWLKPESRSQIREAYRQRRKELAPSIYLDPNKILGPGNTKSPTPPDRPSESSKEMLENAIKKNSPLLNSPPTQPQQP